MFRFLNNYDQGRYSLNDSPNPGRTRIIISNSLIDQKWVPLGFGSLSIH